MCQDWGKEIVPEEGPWEIKLPVDQYPQPGYRELLCRQELFSSYEVAAPEFGLTIEVMAKPGEQYVFSGIQQTVSEGYVFVRISGQDDLAPFYRRVEELRAAGS
jgi:hypothetical protein